MPVFVALELCSFVTSNLFRHRHYILSGFVRLSNDFVGLDRVFETALWLSSALTIDNTLFRISFCSCSNLMHVACWEVILHLEFSYFASHVWVLTLGFGLFVRWLSCSLSWWPLLFCIARWLCQSWCLDVTSSAPFFSFVECLFWNRCDVIFFNFFFLAVGGLDGLDLSTINGSSSCGCQ